MLAVIVALDVFVFATLGVSVFMTLTKTSCSLVTVFPFAVLITFKVTTVSSVNSFS